MPADFGLDLGHVTVVDIIDSVGQTIVCLVQGVTRWKPCVMIRKQWRQLAGGSLFYTFQATKLSW